MTRPKIDTRFARDEDGSEVRMIADDSGLFFEDYSIEWDRLQPYWLVSEIEGDVVAAMQVIPSFPIGRMDCLLVSPRLSKIDRGRVVLEITKSAERILAMAGCKIAGSYIASKREDGFLKDAENRGWVPVQEIVQMFKRLV